MHILHAIYGKKVILLIDEYDVPLTKASEKNTVENKYYLKMYDIIHGIMHAAFKDNEFLKFGLFTGCLDVIRGGTYTGLNNFVSYSILDKTFSQYFGFSEDEVEKCLRLQTGKKLYRKLKNGITDIFLVIHMCTVHGI